MKDVNYLYIPPRSQLIIESVGAENPRACYREQVYKIISFSPLNLSRLKSLVKYGFIPDGQMVCFKHVCADKTLAQVTDKTPEPTFTVTVECSEVDKKTGKVLSCPAKNPYSGEFYKPSSYGYYVYECRVCIDSGD